MKEDTKQAIDKYEIFEKELFPHADALYNFGFHLTYSGEDANDLVQETYMKAYNFIESYTVGTNAKAWLFKILKNAFINEYRKKVRQPTKIDYEDVAYWHDSEDISHIGSLDLRHEIFQDLIGDEVTIALNQLPVDFRTIILLCDLEGFTYEEIAKIMDIPIGTVRSRLHRARNILKEKLKKYATSLGFKDKKNK